MCWLSGFQPFFFMKIWITCLEHQIKKPLHSVSIQANESIGLRKYFRLQRFHNKPTIFCPSLFSNPSCSCKLPLSKIIKLAAPAQSHLLMATFHRQKPVWVAVYVEKPIRKSFSRNHQQQHHHHHHHHLHLHQAKNACRNPGYNRKAHLLEYSRQLRESARSQASSPLLPVSHHHHHSQPQPMTQILPVQKKRKHSVTPTCLSNWKFLIPGVIRSLLMPRRKEDKKRKKNESSRSTSRKIKAVVKSFQVKKKGGFTLKMFASHRKHR